MQEKNNKLGDLDIQLDCVRRTHKASQRQHLLNIAKPM